MIEVISSMLFTGNIMPVIVREGIGRHWFWFDLSMLEGMQINKAVNEGSDLEALKACLYRFC